MPARMPSRKEPPKEAVVYPASKRKAPPFKPLSRPLAKVPRVSTTESEGSTKAIVKAVRAFGVNTNDDDEDEEGDEEDAPVGAGGSKARAGKTVVDSDEELEDDPLTARRPPPPPEKTRRLPTTAKPGLANRQPAGRPGSPTVSIPSQSEPASSPPPPPPQSTKPTAGLDNTVSPPPPPTQLSDPTQLPQPLLTRLLHEHFTSSTTKIDRHALQVLQKYLEIFVREGIARTALAKQEKGERGEVDGADEVRWLEVGDLEEVAAGMMMDF